MLLLLLFDTAAKFAAFDGSAFVRIELTDTRATHTNDVSVRFKTQRPNGLLLITSNRQNNGYFKLSLHNGRGVVETNINGERRVSCSILCIINRVKKISFEIIIVWN